MFLGKIRDMLGIKKQGDEKEIIISCERLERRVALLEGGRLEEFAIERDGDRQISGNIYKGRVKNLESGLKAMFVDIGIDKNAFLHYWDAIPAALDSSVEAIERTRPGSRKKSGRRITAEDIPKLYPPGSDVIVQVTKGPIGTKGPRITTNISLAGRYLVLMPFTDQFGISRKIESQKERQRLRKILNELEVPEGMGVIIRTVGEGQRSRFFVRDLAVLLDQWKRVDQKLQSTPAPSLLLAEPDLIERTVRDFLTDEIDRIIVDNEEAAQRIRDLIGAISKRSQRKIRFYNEPTPIFERFNVDKQIDGAFRRQVWLPCGGYLVIDETEALVAIDVNTGRNKGPAGRNERGGQEKTLTQTNLEAAEEVARQLRLRNIGGLVIIDFIDMKDRRDQQAVLNKLKENVRRDKAKTNILPISSLGLLEMTRQRVQESISRSLYMECPHCRGRGMIKSAETMSVEIQRGIIRALRLHPDVHELRIHVNAVIMDRLKNEDEELLIELERKFQGRLSFRVDPKLSPEEFKLVNVTTEEEIGQKPEPAPERRERGEHREH